MAWNELADAVKAIGEAVTLSLTTGKPTVVVRFRNDGAFHAMTVESIASTNYAPLIICTPSFSAQLNTDGTLSIVNGTAPLRPIDSRATARPFVGSTPRAAF